MKTIGRLIVLLLQSPAYLRLGSSATLHPHRGKLPPRQLPLPVEELNPHFFEGCRCSIWSLQHLQTARPVRVIRRAGKNAEQLTPVPIGKCTRQAQPRSQYCWQHQR